MSRPQPLPTDPSLGGPPSGAHVLGVVAWAWGRLTARPLVFLVVTAALLVATLATTMAFESGLSPDAARSLHQLRVGLLLGVALVQVAAVAGTGLARYALAGGGVFGVSLVLPAVLSGRVGADDWVGVIATGFLNAGLFWVVSLAAVVGYGLWSARRERERRRNLTRQELLERLFEVRRRLESAVQLPDEPAGLMGMDWFRIARRKWGVTALAVGIGVSLLNYGLLTWLDPAGQIYEGPDALAAGLDPAASLALAFAQLSTVATMVLVGFVAGTAGRGLLAGIAATSAQYAPVLIPYGAHGAESARLLTPQNVGVMFGLMVVLALVGGFGARFEEAAARQRRLIGNDVDALRRERAELEQLLRPATQRVGVLSVDVRASSRMKADSDPFDAEWTFREYQRWVAGIVNWHLGTLYSTAGDGAIAGFPTARAALEAALALQNGIAAFNDSKNRLPMPFRLRVGLHAGEIEGRLEQVEFSSVIDLAVIAESRAPVGGVAATHAVVDELPDEFWSPLGASEDEVPLFEWRGSAAGAAR